MAAPGQPKTGGRLPGSRNKATLERLAAEAAGTLAPMITPKFPGYKLARVDHLVGYENNARVHSPAQIKMLARLITEYGFTNPVLTDGKRGIIAGHGRVMAAQSLGMDQVPTIELKHLTAAQRRAYVIADNQSAINGASWNMDLLALELGELRDDGFDLSLTGFDGLELDRLLGDPDQPQSPDGFDSYDEDIETEHECPKCGYVFSGGKKVAKEDAAE